jgi:hypothetical protein
MSLLGVKIVSLSKTSCSEFLTGLAADDVV